MTREEAKEKMCAESVQYKNGLRTVALRKVNNFINQLFNDHEAQIRAKDKADYKIGAWLSAALEDKTICTEFRKDIEDWFSSKILKKNK